MRFCIFLLLLFNLLIPNLTFSNNSNYSAVSWITDNSILFSVDTFLIPKVFIGKESVFKIPSDNFFLVDKRGGLSGKVNSFENSLIKALEVIKNEKEPTIFINVLGHGSKGYFLLEDGREISHEDFLDLLFSTIDQYGFKDLHINVFYPPCHGSSIIPFFEKMNENNDHRYYKTNVFMGSTSGRKTPEGTFYFSLLTIASLNKGKANLFSPKDWVLYQNLRRYPVKINGFQQNLFSSYAPIWSSYEAYNSKLTIGEQLKVIEEMIYQNKEDYFLLSFLYTVKEYYSEFDHYGNLK
jgi:hypothetical protein